MNPSGPGEEENLSAQDRHLLLGEEEGVEKGGREGGRNNFNLEKKISRISSKSTNATL